MNFTTCLVFTIAVSAVSSLPALEEGKDIPLEAPEGWKGETISLPPGFAPGMKLQGLEKIRFAPGMFKPEFLLLCLRLPAGAEAGPLPGDRQE